MSPAPLYPIPSLEIGGGFLVELPGDLGPEARAQWAHRRRTALYALARRHGVRIATQVTDAGLLVTRVG